MLKTAQNFACGAQSLITVCYYLQGVFIPTLVCMVESKSRAVVYLIAIVISKINLHNSVYFHTHLL
jgi:hypothetical protein